MALFAYKHPWTHCQSKSMLKLLTFSLPRRGSLLSLLFLSSSDSQVKPMVKNPPVNAGDIRDKSSIPGLGRSPGGGHGNPLQGFGGKEGWGLSLANDQGCSSHACRAWATVSFLGTLLEGIFLEHMSSASQW